MEVPLSKTQDTVLLQQNLIQTQLLMTILANHIIRWRNEAKKTDHEGKIGIK
jgi:hypothetical protein